MKIGTTRIHPTKSLARLSGSALRLWLIVWLLQAGVPSAFCNPQGLTVARGAATTSANGPTFTINASHGAVLDWKSFNIQRGETTTFVQPSANSVVWNKINDPNLSQIWGTMNANGWVVLMNQNGFYFGPNSVVNVNGLIVTTVPTGLPPSAGGGIWQYTGPMPLATIINHGEIKAKDGGSVFLISEKIENHGTISAPGGTVSLQAGQEVLISDRPDGRGLTAKVKLPVGSIDNQGKIIADAGTIALHAQTVNQNGFLQANSVRQNAGVIELVASENVNLGAESLIQAKGDDTGVSPGGSITVKSEGTYADTAGSRIDVSGGAQGGDGGFVEVSAPLLPAIDSEIRGTGFRGWRGGSLLLDPTDIVLGASGSGAAPGGAVSSGDTPTTLNLNVNAAFFGFHNIRLQATRDITLNTIWNLNNSTGVNLDDSSLDDPNCSLILEAGRNIIFGKTAAGLVAGSGWSINLSAGVDFSYGTVRAGQGNIYIGGAPNSSGKYTGTGYIEAADRAINLTAGQDIALGATSSHIQNGNGIITLDAGHDALIGNGYVKTTGADADITLTAQNKVSLAGSTTAYVQTTGGGDIQVNAVQGSVDAGAKDSDNKGKSNFGFEYTMMAYEPSSTSLGGFTTVHGGNVEIQAGGDILSIGPVTGAYGSEPANVTLHSGGNVSGRFLVRNGQGLITSGVTLHNDNATLESDEITASGSDIGSPNLPLTLGLISGGWHLFAANSIYMNEVLNPNGTYNNNKFGDQRVQFMHDYAQDASITFTAGNSVQLLGNSPAHTADNPDRLPIYPPQLSIHAGSGGVVLGNDVVLYPSPKSSLDITTTDQGPFSSVTREFYQLIMSDSGDLDYKTFASGHAETPLHKGSSGPVTHLDISGNLQNLFLRSAGSSEIKVGGNALNFSYEGQNLSSRDVTSIEIAGNYISELDRTTVTLSGAVNTLLLDPNYSCNPALSSRLSYDPVTGQLTLQGRLSETEYKFLQNPSLFLLDLTGKKVLDDSGSPITYATWFSGDTAKLATLNEKSQNVPVSALAFKGMQIGGPGRMDISARNMDLGISHGIRSVGTFLNNSLAQISLTGADLVVKLLGNLEMTSSQIASFNGGAITATAGGYMNVGSQFSFTSDDTPRGIFTGHGGEVKVEADGDIQINGSRIATYDGGNVTVTSKHGDVNAGAGARGFFSVTSQQYNDQTGELEIRNDRYFGSGIIAFTRSDSSANVGNIFVNAARDILANAGGVIQLAFNYSSISDAKVTLNAGRDIIADQSGVLGANAYLKAGRDIKGLVVSVQNSFVDAARNAVVSVLAGKDANVNAGGSLGGLVVGGGNVSASAKDAVTATLVASAGSLTASGDTSSAKMGIAAAAGNVPTVTRTTTEAEQKPASAEETEEEKEMKRRLAEAKAALARTVGRVTVILPTKTKS
jgi:filamentous hemagglutinin family protein